MTTNIGCKTDMQYIFVNILQCNMCGSPVKNAYILGKRMNQTQGKRPTSKIGISTTVVKCSVCQLIYSNPMPIPVSIGYHYDIPPESYWEPQYFDLSNNYFKDQIATFFSLHSARHNLRALDLGAGIGKCMIALCNAGFDAYGIEPSKSFFRYALEKMNISPDKLKHSSVEDAEYPIEYFDFIVYGAVLEHFYDPSSTILKTMEWLKPGGLIHIEVPSSAWLTNKIANFIYRVQGLDYCSNISPMHPPFHLYEFGLKSFHEHGRHHKYEIVFSKFMVCTTYLPKVFDPVLKMIMAKTNTGMQLEVWIRKHSQCN